MGSRPKSLLVTAILVFAVFAAYSQRQSSVSAAQPLQGGSIGVNFNCQAASSADMATVYSSFSKAHAGWVRIYLPWFPIEPKPGQFDTSATGTLAKFESCVNQAHDAGFRVLVVFLNNPSWASTAWNTAPNPKTYASALAFLAKRYQKQVSGWEVWNEENTKFFWKGTAIQYVRVLRAAYKAVKQANPNALVVFGGTAHNDAGWVRKCYRAGAKGYFDVMATHPYPWVRRNGGYRRTLGFTSQIRQVMIANHDESKPIWFTEYGWSRSEFSPRRQARLMYKSLDYIGKRLPYVQESFWYEAKTEDPSSKQNRWESGLSLLTADGGKTPAFRAMARYARQP